MRPVLLSILLLLLVISPASASADSGYVALGDSYASGPGIPAHTGEPAGCGRSDQNYPAVLARWLRAQPFTDVSCGGATTEHMSGAQPVSGGTNPPQLDALRPDTALVTLTIGGNDIGFGEILATCGRLGAGDPTGDPCRRHYTASGRDVLAGRIQTTAGRIATVLTEIKKRSPRAKLVVVGYLRILPDAPGCWPQVPFAAKDTAYFDATERLLNRSTAEVARAAGARFVNPYLFSAHRDACQVPERRWVEPLRPASPAASMHPNAAGMKVVAGLTWLVAR
ncbi:MAG: SGNH/GDSL hydrolase family protein [Actinomycetota bacterium]|nr:SGNH/GDSL hydrolase family protein [Actinomycetota bacterium]